MGKNPRILFFRFTQSLAPDGQTGSQDAAGRSGRAGSRRHIRCGTIRACAGSAPPARRTHRDPPVSHGGGMTLKPSAAPFSNQVWMLSATCSGVPGNDPVPSSAGEPLNQLADGGFLAIDDIDHRLKATSHAARPLSIDQMTRERLIQVEAQRSSPIIWRSCVSEYSGWIRSLNSCSSRFASASVLPMNGLMPGNILTCSGLRSNARACFFDVRVERLRAGECLDAP